MKRTFPIFIHQFHRLNRRNLLGIRFTSMSTLEAQITSQGDKVRQLKAEKAEKSVIDAEVAVLLDLKAQLKKLDVNDKKTDGPTANPTEKDDKVFTLKTPKGTKDYFPREMAIREKMFSTITTIFKRHGAVTIDTPVFELKEILAGKYGEDSKLIYDLQDQGGELCALRYDLTVPFARFLACSGGQHQNIKRYHIGKVYRRDQPSVTKGRMREFYQCDFDIAGQYDPMIPDAEVLRIMTEALTALDIGSFTIKVNHRKILDGMFEVCGVPPQKFRIISSAVDKLDKMPWEDVKKEMVHEKGLDEAAADKIGEYVKLHGSKELVDTLLANPVLMANASAKQGVEEMKLLLDYLEVMKVLDKVSFDLSLARGLDYYTGAIFEAIFNNPADGVGHDAELVGVGSIAAGGRYDGLVGMFSNGKMIPCVGISLGIERIFSILLRKTQLEQVKSNEVEVYVIGVGDGALTERMKICTELWDNDIKAEFMYKAKPKLQPQFNACDKEHIPLSIIIGKSEIEQGLVKIKNMSVKDEGGSGGDLIPRTEMISEIKKRLGRQ